VYGLIYFIDSNIYYVLLVHFYQHTNLLMIDSLPLCPEGFYPSGHKGKQRK